MSFCQKNNFSSDTRKKNYVLPFSVAHIKAPPSSSFLFFINWFRILFFLFFFISNFNLFSFSYKMRCAENCFFLSPKKSKNAKKCGLLKKNFYCLFLVKKHFFKWSTFFGICSIFREIIQKQSERWKFKLLYIIINNRM